MAVVSKLPDLDEAALRANKFKCEVASKFHLRYVSTSCFDCACPEFSFDVNAVFEMFWMTIRCAPSSRLAVKDVVYY
jgi:hypothetical protein